MANNFNACSVHHRHIYSDYLGTFKTRLGDKMKNILIIVLLFSFNFAYAESSNEYREKQRQQRAENEREGRRDIMQRRQHEQHMRQLQQQNNPNKGSILKRFGG